MLRDLVLLNFFYHYFLVSFLVPFASHLVFFFLCPFFSPYPFLYRFAILLILQLILGLFSEPGIIFFFFLDTCLLTSALPPFLLDFFLSQLSLCIPSGTLFSVLWLRRRC